jgi:hypothetical protein
MLHGGYPRTLPASIVRPLTGPIKRTVGGLVRRSCPEGAIANITGKGSLNFTGNAYLIPKITRQGILNGKV